MTSSTFTRLDTFIHDFETIVNIDSASGNLAGIQRVAQFFQKRFSAIGLETELLFLSDKKVPCLQARTRQAAKPFDFMFLGHMDTVFPQGEVKKRPFSIQGNQALGPGVCDMKGGLLVVLHAVEQLKAKGLLDQLSLCIAFNGDEETGSEASKNWIKTLAKESRRALVFEPCRPGYHVVTQRKGGGWFQVTVTGQEAHAGADPEKGANAVVEIAHQIVAINGLNDPEQGTSAQVTVVHGGDKVNIIPATANAMVDIRIAKIAEKKRVETFFDCLPQKTILDGVTLTVSGQVDRPPMEPTPASRDLLKQLVDQGKTLGVDIHSISTGGCSDGNFVSASGTPTIDGLGLVGANSHRQDEYVELASIPVMVNLITNLVADYLAL
ncbi:MAG: M20 family metallopeptidase [Proteobacteria bacterium]|nr:M20 family metallopeptidase [Desulfobacula sp.]MBU3953546.1 M20 family metallopeptidase [Pseudomonadota bacterium]MBU4129870.1 M20 family metallopeptidase [Pseudomonadota bacterium]